ncbi:SHOCT domain-containing protein [Salsipaludibacter albus]|uniref:SHOCT domain-containing protein n=1 Tax=Salsipaludibacter albus TaxID=2849650 RepID=UPI001EE3ACFE|nr:SHOCT domain-containing protein [Salsipaludibacter albus]MBY5162510.1 SHOCT domain-containing protein [Salsipaludibacter albus]
MPLLDLFWTMLMVFLFVAWIWVLISVVSDLFRDHETGGWAKAFWVLFILVIPWLGVLIYLIAKGDGMAERRVQDAKAADEAARAYIRDAAGGGGTQHSVADELAKLAELRDSGTITDQEFQAQKSSLLA